MLEPYQRVGIDWLKDHRRAINADQMGLGKTIESIVAVKELGYSRILVICPKSLIYQWKQHIAEWDDRSLASWTVVNYEKVKHLDGDWQAVIVDESVRIKNPTTERTIAVMQRVIRAQCVYFLTGTPVRNHPKDLFVMAAGCIPELLRFEKLSLEANLRRSYWRWIDETFVVKENPWGGKDIRGFLPGREAQIQTKLNRIMLRRTKELLNLPPLTREVLALEMIPTQAKEYATIERGLVALANPDGSIEPHVLTNALAQLTRLRQCAVDPGLIPVSGHSAKSIYLQEWWESHREDSPKVIVFSQFAQYVRKLQDLLPDALAYHGGLSDKQREGVINEFNSDRPHVLCMSAESGAFGLNLQVADVVIWTDLPLTPDTLEQGTARAHRRGQQHAVHEIILSHPNSVDDTLRKILRRKDAWADRVGIAREVIQEIAKEVKNEQTVIA